MGHDWVAWLEMFALFFLLYFGIPIAGLQLDGILGLPPWPLSVRALGIIVLTIGIAGLAWCIALFVRIGRGTPNPIAPPRTLVTVGPYAWSRNPIALSHAIALIGLSLVVGSVSAVAVVIVLGIPIHFAMLHEERTLEARFGAAYRAYAASVPRWIPRLGKRHS
jgi:protein-S-isoprenylcysteine O-methyltransferase Ste14